MVIGIEHSTLELRTELGTYALVMRLFVMFLLSHWSVNLNQGDILNTDYLKPKTPLIAVLGVEHIPTK